ncbi:CBS domain-containing protein [Ignisphaera sp. 4213-co]|uniref:CBS domain-containing protein n=1 Tax=Ignisphaera cupida TaxID=3050454 RepID=A0ABD4Z6K4_9CREN|nr:CBS domain-containing protein [Ignisphaera sp. 4213-co]MDK6028248.1 CBS domain-containing protein [Ignisphaera sp. 4213-co]
MLRASDVMVPNPICVRINATVYDAIKTMEKYNIASVIVVDENDIVFGVVTAKDIVIKTIAKGLDPKLVNITQILSKPVTVVDPDTPLKDVINLMIGTGHGHIPVVNKIGKVIGIVTIDDVLKYVPELLEYVEMKSR